MGTVGAMAPSIFGRSVNSIQRGLNSLVLSALSQPVGGDYDHQIILAPPDFQTFQQPYACILHAQILFRRIEVEDVHWVLFLAEVSHTNQVVPATFG